jgi:PAS domain S-box-containing protein
MPLSTPGRTTAQRVLLALAAAGGALLLQWALTPWIGTRLPFLLVEPAILFTAAALGRPLAALVMLIGAANAAVAFTPPGQWFVTDPTDLMAIAAYALIGAALIACGSRLHLRDLGDGRAERAEQRLSLAQDETGVGLFELDYRAGTAYASPALCKMLGQPVMTRGWMPLQDWLQALDAGHVADSRRAMQQRVAAGELRYEREMRVELPDGRQHWLLSRVRLDLDERGELAAARGATLDITARKQLLTDLEAARAQLQQQLDDLGLLHQLGNRLLAMPFLDSALQAMLDAVCAFHGARAGLLRLYDAGGGSRVVARWGLLAETDNIGDGGETGDALAQLAVPDLPTAADALCGTAAETARRLVVEDLQATPETQAGPDTLRRLARAAGVRALHSTPLLGGVGGTPRVLGVFAVLSTHPGRPDERLLRLTDLCAGQAAALIEREQALSLARETQQRFEVALQSSSVAFTILAPLRDADGRVVDFAWTYANPAAAAMIGRPAHEVLGRPILQLLPHAWDEPGFFDRYVQVCEQGCTAEFDTLTHRPGFSRWLHVIASPLNGSVMVWFTDITQQREEQRALQDADRRKDEFLATLAHELRNPLAPIRHAAEIMSMPAADGPQRQWSLAVIERQLRHMALLLDDLLDVSRITRGTLPLRRERCELRPIVEAAVETSHPLFRQRRHRLDLNLPDEPVTLDVDPMRMAQVLGNLLANAAKYTPPGGHVIVSAGRNAGEVVLTVTDNGNGLAPEDCERVFDMFVQIPSAEGRLQGGLGIGLALARKLMAMHGGRLEASSAGLGLGSTFTVRLPEAARDGPAAAAFEPVTRRLPANRRRILIADDNRDAADSLAVLLQLDGHEVQVAYDGREALERFGSFGPQVALLDLDMPGHHGGEVATQIRARPGGGAITLVAITGFGQQRDRLQALQSGFDHHLTKPIELGQLHQLLEGVSAVGHSSARPAGAPASGAAA